MAFGVTTVNRGSVPSLAIAGALALCALPVWGQSYPARPIRLVTSAVGGAGDFVSRTIGQAISPALGQAVVVDNRGSLPGIEAVARARADGYTLLLTSNIFWLLPLLQKVSFDPMRDFTHVALTVTTPNVVVVHPSLPARSVKELVALARSRPGELNYAGGSTGTASHLAGELFKIAAQVNIVFVPHKGAGPALNDAVAGHVQVLFSNLAAAGPHVAAGRLRALAVTSAQPSPLAPDLPTVSASGLPGYESEAIYGVFGPAGLPPSAGQRIHQEVTRALHQPEVRERFAAMKSQIVAGTGADLSQRVAGEIRRMSKVIAQAGIRLDADTR